MTARFDWVAERERNARTWRACYLGHCLSAREAMTLAGRPGSRDLATRQLLYGQLGLLMIRVARRRDERDCAPKRELDELRAEKDLAEIDMRRIRLARLRSHYASIENKTIRAEVGRVGRRLAHRVDIIAARIAWRETARMPAA